MRRSAGVIAVTALLSVAAPGAAGAAPTGDGPLATGETERLLVFHRTETFWHNSIPTAIETLTELGEANGFEVDQTIETDGFTLANLRRYSAVIFALPTGDVLNPHEQRALRKYMRKGGGYMGIHSAADTEHGWPFYERIVGTLFKAHPLLNQPALFFNEAPVNPATKHLPAEMEIVDEHYSFQTSPRESVHVLLSIDESTYDQDPNTSLLNGAPFTGTMGDHPMSWCHRNAGGPTFYTALGHLTDLYAEPWYREHLLGGIRIATGRVKPTCAAP